MFFIVTSVYSSGDDVIDLESIFNEIMSRHSLWEDFLNRYNILINYEDILKMEKHHFFAFYRYRNMVFQQNGNNGEEYRFILSKYEQGVEYSLVVILKYIDGFFFYQNHELQRIDMFYQ